ncbi:MAG: 50S ribosomal protein L23 [Pseudomonadota bacterium]
MSWRYFKKETLSDDKVYDIIRAPLVSEKTTMISQENCAVFKVAPYANKTSIKQAVEKLFSVNVEAVNIIGIKPKLKRFRGRIGFRAAYKKAVVTLKKGQSIDMATEL